METEKHLRSQIQYDLSYQIDFDETYDSNQGIVVVSHIHIRNNNIEQLHEALKTVEKSLIPLSDKELLARLTIMFSVLNKQNMSDEDLTLKIKSLMQLINYEDQIPADIIINAINHLTRHSKGWYPSYPEIISKCSHAMDIRKKLHSELHKRIKTVANDKQIMHN